MAQCCKRTLHGAYTGKMGLQNFFTSRLCIPKGLLFYPDHFHLASLSNTRCRWGGVLFMRVLAALLAVFAIGAFSARAATTVDDPKKEVEDLRKRTNERQKAGRSAASTPSWVRSTA